MTNPTRPPHRTLLPENWARAAVVVMVLACAAACIAVSFRLDPDARQAVYARQGSDWKNNPERQVWKFISRQGDWPQLMVLGGLGLFVAVKLRRREWVQILAAAMLASTLSGILANASRLTTGRVRPREEAKLGEGFQGPYHEGKWTIGDPGRNSFPSGHTATAFGFAAPLFYARPRYGWLALVGAAAIACSRMMLGAHHFSDVVTSILLAMAVGWFVGRWTRDCGQQTFDALRDRIPGWSALLRHK